MRSDEPVSGHTEDLDRLPLIDGSVATALPWPLNSGSVAKMSSHAPQCTASSEVAEYSLSREQRHLEGVISTDTIGGQRGCEAVDFIRLARKSGYYFFK